MKIVTHCFSREIFSRPPPPSFGDYLGNFCLRVPPKICHAFSPSTSDFEVVKVYTAAEVIWQIGFHIPSPTPKPTATPSPPPPPPPSPPPSPSLPTPNETQYNKVIYFPLRLTIPSYIQTERWITNTN